MNLPWKHKPTQYNSDKKFGYIRHLNGLSKLKFVEDSESVELKIEVLHPGEKIICLPLWEGPWTSEGWKHIAIYYETLIACLRRCVLFLLQLWTAEIVRVNSGAIPTRNCWFGFVIHLKAYTMSEWPWTVCTSRCLCKIASNEHKCCEISE